MCFLDSVYGADDYSRISCSPGPTLPLHFVHWRIPDGFSYVMSLPGHPNTLRTTPSVLNLTAIGEAFSPSSQSFVGRRQLTRNLYLVH